MFREVSKSDYLRAIKPFRKEAILVFIPNNCRRAFIDEVAGSLFVYRDTGIAPGRVVLGVINRQSYSDMLSDSYKNSLANRIAGHMEKALERFKGTV